MSAPPLESLTVGAEVPIVTRTPTALDLFMFSGSAWLLHRIHYDLPFATEHDGHPGLLIHGPLQGVYLVQSVQRWLGRAAQLASVQYRHHIPAYLGETLDCGGSVAEVDTRARTVHFELWVRKDDEVTTSGHAAFTVRKALAGEAVG